MKKWRNEINHHTAFQIKSSNMLLINHHYERACFLVFFGVVNIIYCVFGYSYVTAYWSSGLA